MTANPALNAIVELALMLAVVAGYILLARRVRVLWHPLAITCAVGIVGVAVSVLGDVLFQGAAADVPAMLRRSAVGSFGWGVVIAAGVWAGRRLMAKFDAGRAPSHH